MRTRVHCSVCLHTSQIVYADTIHALCTTVCVNNETIVHNNLATVQCPYYENIYSHASGNNKLFLTMRRPGT